MAATPPLATLEWLRPSDPVNTWVLATLLATLPSPWPLGMLTRRSFPTAGP